MNKAAIATRTRRRRTLRSGVPVIVALAIVSAAWWFVIRDPVRENRFDEIRSGMSERQVLAILGRRPDTRTIPIGKFAVDGGFRVFGNDHEARPQGARPYPYLQWDAYRGERVISVGIWFDDAGRVVNVRRSEGKWWGGWKGWFATKRQAVIRIFTG